MPEGDTLHRAARRLQVLVGERLEVESPHPRAQAERVAEQLDGRRLDSVDALGKNLVLRFEGGVVLRSHLRMSGRWSVRPRGESRVGRPWLVLRGSRAEGVLWNGPVLELHTRALARLGPDILAAPPDLDAMLARMRPRRRHAALRRDAAGPDARRRDREHVDWPSRSGRRGSRRGAGSPTCREAERRRALETAATLMRASVDAGREPRKQVHGRAGRPCPRCGTPIRSRGQGDANRTAYWCPSCQAQETSPRGAY